MVHWYPSARAWAAATSPPQNGANGAAVALNGTFFGQVGMNTVGCIVHEPNMGMGQYL